jgi:hypothetical protein
MRCFLAALLVLSGLAYAEDPLPESISAVHADIAGKRGRFLTAVERELSKELDGIDELVKAKIANPAKAVA